MIGNAKARRPDGDVYFAYLTGTNVWQALMAALRGKRVHYFAAGRVLRARGFSWVLSRRLRKVEYQVSDFPGLNFRIHKIALDAAEELYRRIASDAGAALGLWERTFRSDRVHVYVKKFLAIEAWHFVKAYLVLASVAQAEGREIELVVPDTPLVRLFLPSFLARHGDPRVRLANPHRLGISLLFRSLVAMCAVLVVVLRSVWRGGLVLRGRRRRYLLAKEILWGIGQGRRGDDFVIDDRVIRSEDVLFYFRPGSAGRLPRPEFLSSSLAAAVARGSTCVDWSRVPVSLGTLRSAIWPRYIQFPAAVSFLALARAEKRVAGALLQQVMMAFLRQGVGWDIFAAAHLPELNLSQDDERAEHIAATVVLNLHGARNAGFQYANVTQWRAFTTAHVSYNLYLAWGPFVRKCWDGDWKVDRFEEIGYLWGHHYLESYAQREEIRAALLDGDPRRRFVVALFDENPSPDYLSAEGFREFYRLGASLLERRPDTVVVIKPKRFAGVPEVPGVHELLAPYVESGRLKIWDRGVADSAKVIAVADAVVSMIGSAPHLEAICCGVPGFNYDPSGNRSAPFYEYGHGEIAFDNAESLLKAIERVLDGPSASATDDLGDFIDDLDPYRDFRAIERMRQALRSLAGRP